MSISDAKELHKKVNPITVAFMLALVTLGYFLGTSQAKLEAQDQHFQKEIQHVIQMLDDKHTFALEEVGGLRNDVNREVQQIEQKLQKLEQNFSQ